MRDRGSRHGHVDLGEDGDVVPLHSDADRVDPDLAGGREGKLGVSTDRIVSHAPPLASPMT